METYGTDAERHHSCADGTLLTAVTLPGAIDTYATVFGGDNSDTPSFGSIPWPFWFEWEIHKSEFQSQHALLFTEGGFK